MKKETFYFDSRDGKSKLHAVRYLPDTGDVTCVLQIVHGMAEYMERYEELAAFLTEKGFVVTGEDHLGHGKSVPEGGRFGYFCEQDPATVVVRDVHRLKKLTQELYPSAPYVILGHSMGSFILRNYLCKYGSGISGAVIVGTGMQSRGLIAFSKMVAAIQKLFCGGKHVSQLINVATFGSYTKRIENPRTLADWLSRNEENVDRYVADPLCNFTFTVNGFQTLFELISRIQKPENLKKVPKELPILMVSGADDPVGAYGEGVRKAYDSLRKAGVKDVGIKLYDGDRHELLNETDRAQVWADIYDWMEDKVIKPAAHRATI
ncbi:MAG: lysophospholipase [Candidatus Gastranaerophilales bacterium]|nr:lysophospholipase [Candidatus Gastranaerophilales bacterium]